MQQRVYCTLRLDQMLAAEQIAVVKQVIQLIQRLAFNKAMFQRPDTLIPVINLRR
ncbi:hypothetical protein D3C75_1305210 [compost metagenome]